MNIKLSYRFYYYFDMIRSLSDGMLHMYIIHAIFIEKAIFLAL